MYDRFIDKCAHSTEWFEMMKNFLKLAFAGDRCERSAHAIGVEIEGYCLSMRCLVILLSMDLYRTT
jgi:hypothetical protein